MDSHSEAAPASFSGWYRRYMRRAAQRDQHGRSFWGYVNETTVENAARAAWNAAKKQANRQ